MTCTNRLKYIWSFEFYNLLENKNLNQKEFDEFVDRYQSFTSKSREQSMQDVNRFINTKFDDNFLGIDNFPESISLYRLVYVEDVIDDNFLGFSWTFDENNLYKLSFLESIGLLDDLEIDVENITQHMDFFTNLKILKAEFQKNQIDFYFTCLNWIRHPEEKEISVKSNPKSWMVEKFDLEKFMKINHL
jgi:hypothetical protein